MGREAIDLSVELHRLTLRYAAPPLLTAHAAVTPVTDLAVLYRMATGVYGDPPTQRYDKPFPYARANVEALRFGSPYVVQIVLPTILVAGGIVGLPKLIPLVKEVILAPGRVRRELAENEAARLRAKNEIYRQEALLEDPESTKRLARAERTAKIAEAHERELRSRKEIASLVQGLDEETRELVMRSYGRKSVNVLLDIARRAENGPPTPEDLSIEPVERPDVYPAPPERIDPPADAL
jgi:hypothetical protein